MHDAYIGGRSENNIKCVVHDDLGRMNRTTRYILLCHWLYELIAQFHSCGTYSDFHRAFNCHCNTSHVTGTGKKELCYEMHYQAVSRNSSEGAEVMFCDRQCRRNLLHVSQSINSPRLGIISQLSGKRSRICSSAQSTKPPYKTSTGTSGNCPTSPQAGHFPLIPIFLDVALVKYNLKLVHFHTLHNL